MKFERLAGAGIINVDSAINYFLDETKIEQKDGFYVLKFYHIKPNILDNEEYLQVTVDYKGKEPSGIQCIYNEVYGFDSFSFEKLINDLHDQHLEDIEVWLMGFLEENFLY